MIQAQRLEALGVLVAGVAHNFNNIMAIIMGTASMQEQLATDPGQLEALRIIDMACQRGRTLVRSLTHFARPSIPNQVPVELRGLLGELRDLLTNTARRNVAIVGAAAPEPVWIMGDPGSFNVAVMNLCLNGLDAMPEGGTLTIRTSIPDPDTVEVDVEDTGEGMTPEVLARVMEPFFTTKAVGKGTGLGLSVTHGVVAAHGGTLEILSRPGEGTRVKLRLPRLRKPVQAAPALPGKPASGLAKVLVVDDEQDVRELLAEMLAMAGATEVTGVPSGEDAIASLKRGEIPDLVILDHNMPGLDGARTLQLIRAEHPDLPVLVSSGEPEVEVRGGYDGMQVEFISKPFTFREIQEKLAGIGAGAERRTNDRRTSA
jgi:CheY-like chemotaxis protein